MSGWLIALLGAAAGVAQASLLAKSAGRRPNPLLLLARLVLVVGVLFLAAREGYLLQGAAGWLAGFALASVVVYRRLR